MLTTHKLKVRMEEIVMVIDTVFCRTDPIARDALIDKYWERPHKSWSHIAFEHSVGKSTLYKWRSELIKNLADELGIY